MKKNSETAKRNNFSDNIEDMRVRVECNAIETIGMDRDLNGFINRISR